MHKHIYAFILISTFLCNMHIHSIDLREILNNNFASLEKKPQKYIEITHSEKTDSNLELTQQKLVLDKWLATAGAGSAILALGAIYLASQNKTYIATFYGVLTAIMGYTTYDRIQYNMQKSCGKQYLRTPADKKHLMLVKQDDGTWTAHYQKSLSAHWSDPFITMDDKKQLNLSREQIEQLAQEIIKHHEDNAEQKNFFASKIFNGLDTQEHKK